MSASQTQFVTGHGRAQIAVVLLAVVIALYLLDLLFNFYLIVLLPGTPAEDLIRLGETNWVEVAKGINGILRFLAFVATTVAFLMWLHRANKNLRSLGTPNPEYTPGWAVGWFFVPFASLVHPYKAVKEIWVESDPQLSEPGGEAWQQPGYSSLVGWWWGCWILMNIASQAVSRLNGSGTLPDETFILAKVDTVVDVITVAAGVLAIYVVRGIDKRQELRHRAFQENYLPPPPPTFGIEQT